MEYLIQDNTLTNIANSIRAKTGSTSAISVSDMATQIDSISSGGNDELISFIEGTTSDLIIPNGCTKIRDYYCKNVSGASSNTWILLSSITFPSGLIEIGKSAFSGQTQLTSLDLPDSLKVIDSDAFWGCSGITNLDLSLNLETIGARAFFGHSAETLEIPSAVKSISTASLSGESLKIVTFKGTPTMIDRPFYSVSHDFIINVPWEYGEIPDEDWGTTTATINYNYTGG